MSEIGWAFIGGKATGGNKGSVQYNDGDTWLTGSDNFKYVEETNTVVVSSSVFVSGTLYANDYHVNVVNETVTNISSNGSTIFGNTSDDTHQFTGSVSINGNFELIGSPDSDLIYELSGTYYSASNGNVPHDATFDRAISPSLVVSGATVFNDPVSIQGGLYGASPIQVYAPLSFASVSDPTQTFSIEPGKIVGNLIFSSSNQNDSFKLEGNSTFQIESDFVATSSYATIDLSKFNTISVSDHPNMDIRRHAEYIVSNVESQTKIPIFTGSNASDLSEYEMQALKIATTETKADVRRNSYKISFGVAHTEFDSNYENLLANNSPDLTASATNSPFESASYDNPEETVVVAEVGSFGEPGEGNTYGVKRGMKIAGNLIPQAIDRTALGKGSVPYPDFETKDLTIGHPAARWGDMYISNDRKIYWGQTRDSYTNFYLDGNPSNTASFGLNSSTENLEVSGATLKLEEGVLINSDGYVNFGNLKGTSGYGFRDSSGTIEYKNQGGTWSSFSQAIASAGVIGPAEDGTYNDGLFTDFTSSMAIGTPIDRFNEIFKIIAPQPAPNVQEISYTNSTGQAVNLSFDASNPISGYENSSTDAGFDAVARNNLYESETSGSNFRLGVYDGTQTVQGVINYNITASVTNGNYAYVADSFGNADNGLLKLELNGATIHTIDLTSGLVGTNSPGSGTDSELNSNSSGFTNISETESTYDGNGSEWYIFKYRTARYTVNPSDQVDGLNYIRIIHEFGSTTATTNYIEWVNDSVGSAQALSVSNQRIEDVTLIGSKFVSGIEYNTDLTANYKSVINNFYRNVYPVGNVITFNETNCNNISAQSAPVLGVGEDETNLLQITGSINNNQNLLLNGTISVSLNATHPLKSNLSNSGLASLTGMLIDNDSSSPNSNLTETFIDEDFRITSGSYDTQLSASSATWDSTIHLTSSGTSGYNDGMIFYNRRLYNPVDADLPNSGDFSALANVETGQPDYSSESGIRTFYRKIENTSGTIRDMKITSQKNGFSFNNDTQTLDSNDAHFYVKIPGSTGWMNLSENFVYGSTSDGDGALINGASDNSNTTGTGNSVHCITFGTQSVANGEHVVIKIETNGMTGYVSQLSFQLGASDVGTPASPIILRDIDCDDDGVNANLSFGTSNTITGYSNATGSTVDVSMSSYDSNEYYENTGDKLGVFSSFTTINGKINADVGGNSNYDAYSFSDAYEGDVVLEVNGVITNTIDVSSTTSSITDTNDSILSVTALDWSTTTDNVPDYTKPFRTGTYQIHTNDQNLGWNYARVYHTGSWGERETNYIEWVVDTNADALVVSNEAITNFGHTDVYYQSGVGYFASRPTGSYSYTVSNVYKNVYSDDSQAINFPTTTRCSVSDISITGTGITTFNGSVSSTSLPVLNNTANCQDQAIDVTASVLFDSLTSIEGGFSFLTDYDVTINSNIKHPIKTNLTTSGLSKSSFMVYSGSNGSTNLTNHEYLNTESYRIVSGNYANQGDTYDAGNAWDSQVSINDTVTYPEHSDGLLTVNGYMISPLKIGNSGDTRNVSDGGTLQAPDSNPNYSTLSENTRTYYRYFRNTTGQAKPTFTLNFYGDAVLVAKSGAFYTGTLGANKNINVELKVPYDSSFTGLDDTSTAWGDCVKPYSAGVQPTSDGIGVYSGGGTGLDQTIDSNSSSTDLGIQLQEKQIRNNQYFVIKITAHKDWTGYLSRISVTY